MIGIVPELFMRGFHDKRRLLAKLRICDSQNCSYVYVHIFSRWALTK